MTGVIKYLFGTTSGRAIVAGLIFLGAMAAARWYYVDRPRQLADEAQGAGAALLESMAEQLDDARGEAADGDAFAATLPKLTEWYPAELPCDSRVPYPAERDSIWEVLGAPKEGKTAFQYRFERTDNTFTMRARRDGDCDGIYSVHKLTGSTDWTSAITSTEMETQNMGE